MLSLIVLGIILIVVELIFIPGTTVVGIIGGVLFVLGQIMAFSYFENSTALGILFISSVFGIGAIVASFKSGMWKRFSLNKVIDSKVNEGYTSALQIGLRGKTLSALRPMGKAEFKDKTYEVGTFGDYIETDKSIEIIDIKGNKIIVELVN